MRGEKHRVEVWTSYHLEKCVVNWTKMGSASRSSMNIAHVCTLQDEWGMKGRRVKGQRILVLDTTTFWNYGTI